MKKVLLWIGGFVLLLAFLVSYLWFFFPDEKLGNFDDFNISLPKIDNSKNGYDKFLAAVKLLNFKDKDGEDAGFQDFSKKLDDLQPGDLDNLDSWYDWDKIHFFLKQNSEFFKAFDELNKFDYFFSDTYLNYKNYPIGKYLLALNSEPRLGRLLVSRILYKLQQNQTKSSLKEILNLISFNHKMLKSSDSIIFYLVRAKNLEQSIRILRMILDAVPLTKDQYLEVLSYLNLFKNDLDQIRLGVFKFEFFHIIDYVDNLHLYTEEYSGGRSWLDLSYSKYHFQPNRTKNLVVEMFRRHIENPYFANDEELLAISHAYNSKFDLFSRQNSLGYVLLIAFVPTLNTGCKDLAIDFDLVTTKTLAAIKLFQLENNRRPVNLEELVPKYLQNLDWMKSQGGNHFSYDSKGNFLYSEFLDKKCNKSKESVYSFK